MKRWGFVNGDISYKEIAEKVFRAAERRSSSRRSGSGAGIDLCPARDRQALRCGSDHELPRRLRHQAGLNERYPDTIIAGILDRQGRRTVRGRGFDRNGRSELAHAVRYRASCRKDVAAGKL